MIVLRAYNEDGSKYDLDVQQGVDLRLDISAIESGDIGKVFGISSQQFALPSTPVNDEYFGNLWNLGAVGSTSFIRTQPCQVLYNGQSIFTGRIYLDNVITNSKGNNLYNVVVVNETLDFKAQIADVTFGQLDWGDYDHNLTYGNITSSWDNNLFSGSIVYPLVEYGVSDKDTQSATLLRNGNGANAFTNAASPLQVIDFKPAVRVSTVLDRIFDAVGYSYTSSFFESEYADSIYVLSTRDETRGASFAQPISQSFRAYASAPTTPSLYVPTIVPFNNEIYDNAGNYNTGTFKFTANATGNYSFATSVRIKLQGVSNTETPRIGLLDLYINGVDGGVPQAFYNLKGKANNSVQNLNANFANVPLTSGDTVEVRITFETEDPGESIEVQAGQTFTTFELYAGPSTISGGSVDVGAVFNPKDNVIAFLNGLIQKFNLVIEPLPNDSKTLSIEPFNTWVDNGSVVDWTDKVDRSIKWSIKHPMAGKAKTITFSDVEDKDSSNQYTIQTFDKIFGQKIYNADSDLSSGERKIGTFFAPTPMKYIEGTNDFIVPAIHTVKEGQKQRFAFKPRLLHFVGTGSADQLYGTSGSIATADEYYFKDEGGVVNSMDYYPIFHHINQLPATSDTKDLHFDNPGQWEYHQNFVNARTSNDAFTEYWAFYINELYDVESRLLTCNVVLEPNELASIRLNDKIFIDGHYYRINKISGANLTRKDAVTVELLKTAPRKLKYPRRRIWINELDGEYNDVVADVNIGSGVVVYNDFYTGTQNTSSIVLDEAATRDGFDFKQGIVSAVPTPLNPPSNNISTGVNYISERATGLYVGGSGNTIEGALRDSTIVGSNNLIAEDTTNISIFGDNISTTGSISSAFVINSTTGSVSLDNVANFVAINPIEPITTASFAGTNAGTILGNVRIQGNQYFSSDIVTGSAGATLYLTGSHLEHYVHLFAWSGSNGTYIVQLPDAGTVTDIQLRFSTNGDYSGGPVVNITPSGSQEIGGDPEWPLNQPYESVSIYSVGTEWLVF